MAETAPLRVQLIAKTEFLAPPDVPWSTDADELARTHGAIDFELITTAMRRAGALVD